MQQIWLQERQGWGDIKDGKQWYTIQDEVQSTTERLLFLNDHPVYHGLSQQVNFSPAKVSALRITVVEPAQNQNWSLSEIEINVLGDQ
jgi:hypothetical protein